MKRRCPGKPRCPHCGSIALTPAEESILVALYTAPSWPTLVQLAKVVNCAPRTVRRVVHAFPLLIMADASRTGGPSRYALTLEGRSAVEALAGRNTETKAVAAE